MNISILSRFYSVKKFFFIVFLLFSFSIHPQEGKPVKYSTEIYSSDWKQVQAEDSKGLPKTALDKVNAIYKKAKADNNPSETIKAILYRVKYIGQVEEDAFTKAIEELQKESETATSYIKPILHSILGEVYWQYYQNNRYYIMQRTKTENFKPSDLGTWDSSKIIEASIAEYTKSIQDIETTKQLKIEVYSTILNHDPTYVPNGRVLRPTLYDFLAHRAIDFFANQEHGLAKPAETFEINDPKYFSDVHNFINLKIQTKDALAYKYYALQILQELSRLHISDPDPSALTEIELKRLNFVYSHSVLDEKGVLYQKALDSLFSKVQKLPASTDVSFALATYWHSLSGKFATEPTEENRWVSKTAYQICEKAISSFPNSDGAQNCRSLQAQIKTKSLALVTEKNIIPNKPFLSLASYRNLKELHFRVYKVNREKMEKVKKIHSEYYEKHNTYINYEEVLIPYFAKEKPNTRFTVNFEEETDFMEHYAEVRLPNLESGQYLILAGTSDDMKTENQAVAFSFANVTNLSFMEKTKLNQDVEFYVLNRFTGLPEENVEATVYIQEYSNFRSRYVISKDSSHKTDKDGFFLLKAKKKYKNYYVALQKGKELFEPIDDYYSSSDYRYLPYNQNPRSKETTNSYTVAKLFLDRAIYRPGQTIYFKGILLGYENKKPSVKTNTSVQVTFYNVNYQQVAQLDLKTNDYGTFSGTFVAPTNVLTGNMSINTNYQGSVSFSVEEYKRPKFSVEFEKVKGTYKLGDSVKIKGFAKAYSGANIDNADVKYRVVRQAKYPYWWSYFHRGWNTSSPQMEIKQGTLKTDAKGYFEVDFEAIPDKALPKEPGLSFTYQVFADVTDINGETRSASGFAYVGYTALVLNVNIYDMVTLEHIDPFDIQTTNLGGEFEPTKGNLTIHKLKNPAHAFREKKWKRPDRFIIPETEYKKDFPNEAYKEEDNFSTWAKEKEVFNDSFDTGKEKKLTLSSLKQWEPGKYVLEIKAKDRFGVEVKDIKYFTVYSTEKRISIPHPTYSWIAPIKATGEPGEFASFAVGSSESVNLLCELEVNFKTKNRIWVQLEPSQKLIKIPIQEEYRGNVVLHFAFVKDNQMTSTTQYIIVPYTNKELKLSFESFRDKLQPGQNEQWKIKVQGSKSEKVVSEMLATLYDMSLDAFRKNSWDFSIYPYNYAYSSWQNSTDFIEQSFQLHQNNWNVSVYGTSKTFDALNWNDVYLYNFRGFYPMSTRRTRNGYHRSKRDEGAGLEEESADMDDAPMMEKKSESPKMKRAAKPALAQKSKESIVADEKETSSGDSPSEPESAEKGNGEKGGEITGVKARSNFQETAFFLPHLISDSNGEITISFTIPEALTKWKMMGLAHTKDLKYGMLFNELVTQKELMVVPNAPRFFREGDSIEFTAKITNLSSKQMTGKAQLEFFDPITSKLIPDKDILQSEKLVSFTAEKEQSTVVKWKLQIPPNISAISYRVLAQSGAFSDGEEMPLPILTNRMLVTETLPLPMRGKDPKTFQLEKLSKNSSDTLVHHKYTLEFTSNPAWYAVQALPYIMEYPYECTEQVFSRFYANSLASHIANSNPKIKSVFDAWRNPANQSTDALLSNLEKNQELKSLMLEETPWVLDSQDETERKKRVALLFDLSKMSSELERALEKLIKNQSSNGGFAWFSGMKENRYITQHIVTGLGHLSHLGVKRIRENSSAWNMTVKAVEYLDQQFRTDYNYLIDLEKKDKLDMSKQQIGYLQIQYLYARSFFPDIPMSKSVEESFEYYKWQAKTYWNEFLRNKMAMGMIALSLHRLKEATPEVHIKALTSHKLTDFQSKGVPKQIIASLKEHSLNSEEMGMYWKQSWGYYWYELPIETQSLMIEVFSEVAQDEVAVNDLKTWLLKQKQTQDWKTTKATAEAIYALLLRGEDWLTTDQAVEITMGSKKVNSKEDKDLGVEVGTGYFKKSYTGSEITNDMGTITVTPINQATKLAKGGVSWGAVYWQYFEQLDKITGAETPLQLKKQLFLQENKATGPVITPLSPNMKLKSGDLVKVRIELRVDRDMEYVHLKDMRASAFEPTNVISRYKWQDGLGYYESTRDAATNFFFDYLPKGTYVFEYPLRVTHNGNFSNGIATIQSMYAPEFSSHSEGIRVKIGE
jgi:uncharacterized protein YfaS (alpha-2-macroglobulin family)